MDRYNHLLKQKRKALGVFEQAKNRLLSVIEQIGKEQERAEKEISDLEHKITEERLGVQYLIVMRGETHNQLQKIEAVLG